MAEKRRGRRGGRTLPLGLDRRVASHPLGGLLTLATAAGASPTARHRWASVGHLTARSLALAKHSSNAVAPVALESLLAAARRDEPGLELLEDFLPNDPRSVVLARRGDQLVRLFPGSVERPVADVERADMVAAAVDDFLIPRLGFGVRDYVDTGLLYVDHAIECLALTWPDNGDDPAGLSAPPRVSAAEYNAAAALVLQPLPAEISGSARRKAALQFATSPAATLPYKPGHPNSVFDRYFAVALPAAPWSALPRVEPRGEGMWFLPLAFIPDALGYGVTVLAGKAAGEADCARRFAQLAAWRARRALWRFGDVIGPGDDGSGPVVSPGNVVQWVSPLGEARAVLVQLVTSLGSTRLPFDGEPVAFKISRDSRAHHAPIRVPMPGGVLTLDARTEVIPLLVTASAGHGTAQQFSGAAAMSLDDLTWAAKTADADSDLFMFCRELAAPDRPQIFGWEAINLWEWWRNNGKTFFGGGIAPDVMHIEPHWGNAEWERARTQASLERAMLATGLPPLSAFDVVERTGTGPPLCTHGASLAGWHERPRACAAGANRLAGASRHRPGGNPRRRASLAGTGRATPARPCRRSRVRVRRYPTCLGARSPRSRDHRVQDPASAWPR